MGKPNPPEVIQKQTTLYTIVAELHHCTDMIKATTSQLALSRGHTSAKVADIAQLQTPSNRCYVLDVQYGGTCT